MIRALLLAAVIGGVAGPAAAETFQPPVRDVIEQARADCESYEGGDFTIGPEAASRVDLTGNGTQDWVIDAAHFSCSSAASLYCGSGGCMVAFVAQGVSAERIASGWSVVDFFGTPVVLLDVHGSLCGGINPTRCVEALTWDPDSRSFTSLAPRPQ